MDKINEILSFIMKHGADYWNTVPKTAIDKEYTTKIKSKWIKNSMEGATLENWKKINYKFYGQYRNNKRHGYGEEYEDDQIVAYGFYKDGKMVTSKAN